MFSYYNNLRVNYLKNMIGEYEIVLFYSPGSPSGEIDDCRFIVANSIPITIRP